MSGLLADAELFATAWSAMGLAAVALAWPGSLVVARGQVLLAIAAAQTAACGAAAAMLLIGLAGGQHVHGDPRIHTGALVGGLLGTAIAWRGSPERSGWLFAAGSAGSVLCVAYSPYGMHDLLALHHSNVLSATNLELVIFLIAAVAMAVLILLRHRELRLLAIDPVHAQACGLAVGRWNLFFGISFGMLISVAVSSLGLLYTFGCLILPTLIAGRLVRTLWVMFLAAPLIGLGGAGSGIVVGHLWDLPPGQAAVCTLAAVYPLAILAGKCLALRK